MTVAKAYNTQKTDDRQSGLVAFYNIQPGNGSGLWFDDLNPHGAPSMLKTEMRNSTKLHIAW